MVYIAYKNVTIRISRQNLELPLLYYVTRCKSAPNYHFNLSDVPDFQLV